MINIGTVVDDRYSIIKEIGRGGTSCVYLAVNTRLGSYRAIKEIRKGVFNADKADKILISESNILTKLDHPGLPKIIDIIDYNDSLLIVMDYIEGISLDKVVENYGAQSEVNVRKWAIQLCDVLDYLHNNLKNPIVYCDMKPANIILKPDGNVVLIDFGMAEPKNRKRLKESYGTYGYAAPEQFDEEISVDERTDIYSLGVTMYNLLTGFDPCLPPYEIKPVRVVNSNLSEQIENIIFVCTKHRKENRYQSVRQLRSILTGSNAVYSVIPYIDAEKKEKKKPFWLIGLTLGILACVMMVCITIFSIDNLYDFDNSGLWVSNDEYIYDQLESYNCVDITYEGEYYTYEFSPEKSGYYSIYSYAYDDCVPVCWVYDSENALITSDNYLGEYTNFQIKTWLDEGEIYYVDVALYDLSEDYPYTGSFDVYVSYDGLEE